MGARLLVGASLVGAALAAWAGLPSAAHGSAKSTPAVALLQQQLPGPGPESAPAPELPAPPGAGQIKTLPPRGPQAPLPVPPQGQAIIEASVIKVEPIPGSLTVEDPLNNQVYVLSVAPTSSFCLEGNHPIPLSRVPIGSDVRASYDVRGTDLFARKVDVYPGKLPSIGPPGWPDFKRATQGTGGSANAAVVQPFLLTQDSQPAAPSTTQTRWSMVLQSRRVCPVGFAYAGREVASAPGTVLPGGGSAVGWIHASDTPGAALQPGQPEVLCPTPMSDAVDDPARVLLGPPSENDFWFSANGPEPRPDSPAVQPQQCPPTAPGAREAAPEAPAGQ